MKKIFALNSFFIFFIIVSCLSISSTANSVSYGKAKLNNLSNECIVVLNEEASKRENLFEQRFLYDSRVEKIEKLTNDFCQGDGKLSKNYKSIFELTFANTEKENVCGILEELNEKEEVLIACPNYEVEVADLSANDSEYNNQKTVFDLIKLQKAWDITTGSASVMVGVLDTGIDGAHPELKSQVDTSLSRDFTYGDTRTVTIAEDYRSHGTHVSGIIGAKGNNGNGISGVCWDITLVSLAVLEGGIGKISDVIRGINYAEEKKIPLLNISLRCYKDWYANVDVKAVYTAALENYSGLAICAAGNEGSDNDGTNPAFPGSIELDNIISVGNSDISDKKYESSNYGKKSVDLFAPGVSIYSTLPGNKYGNLTGTSMATPFVTGVAALLLSKYPKMTPTEVKASILMNVDKISSLSEYCSTGGRLNAYKALSNPHFHSTRYVPKTVSQHQIYCDCGLYSYLENHLYFGGKCALCNAPHTHSYSTQYYNSLEHIEKCICGQTTGSPSPHVITYEDAHDGDNKAICLGCNAELDLRYDGAQINPFSLINRQETKNGSYILSDGIIVLVEEDIEAYFNGTLVFSNQFVYLS